MKIIKLSIAALITVCSMQMANADATLPVAPAVIQLPPPHAPPPPPRPPRHPRHPRIHIRKPHIHKLHLKLPPPPPRPPAPPRP